MTGQAPWFAPALTALLADCGRAQDGALGWLAIRGHRALVLVPCDALGPLGVIRRWVTPALAQHELSMLERLARDEPATVAATVPRHLGKLSVGGGEVTLQSWLPGAPLEAGLRYRGSPEIVRRLRSVADWFLARFAERLIEPAFPNFLSDTILVRLRRRTPGLLAELELERFIDAARGTEAELGVLHNDLHPGNLLFDSGGAVSGVLDWEHAGPGPLWCDWFGFVNEYALLLRGGGRTPEAVTGALERAWNDATALGAQARAQTARLAARSKASREGLDACFRLAAFRFCYARLSDELPETQAILRDTLLRPAPSFSRG